MAFNYVSTSCSNIKLSFVLKSMGKARPWNYNDSIRKGKNNKNNKHLHECLMFGKMNAEWVSLVMLIILLYIKVIDI